MKKMLLFAAIVIGGCGDDGGSTPQDAPAHNPIDAKVFMDAMPDAGPATVKDVTCPATPDGVVATVGDAANAMYSPKITMIHTGGIVKFVMTSIHDAQPAGSIACVGCVADAGITVDFSQTKCKQFTATGKFGFICSNHGFTGQINVDP